MESFWNRSARDKENIRYLQAKSYSPYSEFFGEWMEEKRGITYLTFNAFYRFDDIMEELFGDREILREHRDFLFDLYVHCLVEMEFRSGMTLREFAVHECMGRIAGGKYGEAVAERFLLLDKKEKYYVAHAMLRQEETCASVEKYSEVLTTLLGNAIAYKNKLNVKELLLYVGAMENDKDLKKIEMAEELFQPLGYRLRVFWDRHFSVLDENQTMEIGEIELL